MKSGKLVAFDLIHVLFFSIIYGPVFVTGSFLFSLFPNYLILPFILFLSTFVLIFMVFLLDKALPALRPGKYRFPDDRMSKYWSIRLAFHRTVFLPGLRDYLFSFFIFRYLLLNAFGAKVPFDAKISNDVRIFDPEMMIVGSGSLLGGFSQYSCHYIDDNHLYIKPVVIGKNVNIFVGSLIFPGVEIGDGTVIGMHASLSHDVKIGENTHIGSKVTIGPNVVIGSNVVIDNNVLIEANSIVADFSILRSGTHLKKRSKVTG